MKNRFKNIIMLTQACIHSSFLLVFNLGSMILRIKLFLCLMKCDEYNYINANSKFEPHPSYAFLFCIFIWQLLFTIIFYWENTSRSLSQEIEKITQNNNMIEYARSFVLMFDLKIYFIYLLLLLIKLLPELSFRFSI